MSALKTPAADAPAEEWGAFAVSIPGWLSPRLPWMPYLLSPSGTRNVPNPDHWAWWGWVIHLLQPIGFGVGTDEDGICSVSLWETDENRNSYEGESINIGRAAIAAAAANGRWLGGGE